MNYDNNGTKKASFGLSEFGKNALQFEKVLKSDPILIPILQLKNNLILV